MNQFDTWITNQTIQPFYARKGFEMNKSVHKAIAYVCGLGQFVFYLNGKKVGNHELDPGWTNYKKIVQYVKFDITDYLQNGQNVAGAEIGNGWYIMDDADGYSFHFPAFMPPNPNPYKPYGTNLVFACQIQIEYQDGTKDIIKADSSWKTMNHEVCHSNIYGSEIIDMSLKQEGFSLPNFNDSFWNPATICLDEGLKNIKQMEQFQPPIHVIHTYEANYLHTVGNRRIFDFKQNMSGILEFDIRGKKGTIITLYPAEKLDSEGNVDQIAKNWLPIDTKITYKIGKDNEWEHYRQKFTYFAGKVIAIESKQKYEIQNLRSHAITSAWKESGTFTSDDNRYNQIYDLVKKAIEANMVSVHTDCPTIERFAWQEPNHLMGAAIMYMKDCSLLWKKFLMDMRSCQHTKEDIFYDLQGNSFHAGDGLVPSQCPCYIPNVLPVPGMGSFYDIIPWGSSIILATRWHYQFYGDKQIIKENYEAGVKYLNYLKTKMTPQGFINHGLGDWGNPENELARENIETAFLYADALTLAEFAQILGYIEEANQHTKFAEQVKNNYNEQLLVQDDNGRWFYQSYEKRPNKVLTQACEALPLYWNMVPEDKRADVENAFKQTLIEKNAFVSGEVGLPYIIQTARKLGMNQVIADYITREEHPSYYAFVKDGMTTLGEYWETNPRSHCHDMMGHIIEWYYNGIAGLEIKEPGFKKISIHPFMPESMNSFTCTYQSLYGPICIEGNRKNGIPNFTWSVPKEIEVEQ